MEVLPCSGVQYVGESDCPQQSPGTTFIYDGDSNCVEHGQQVQLADDKMDKLLLNAEGSQKEKKGEVEGRVEELPTSEGHCSGALYFDCEVEDQKQPCNSLYFEDGNLNVQNGCTEPCLASDSSHLIVDTIESELPSNTGEGELSVSEPKWLEQDETVALWVKWRGKWQAGIRCSRADWPLSTLKAKPTHDRKKYVVIFFPHTRIYSWADILLVCPINKFPQPIAHKTHNVGLEMVKDLTIARRFIMQKLAVGMLHISDQLHIEALTENVRNVMSWKEFAMEASRCKGYSDLGRMLPRLQSMILMNYISPDWVQHSFRSWVERCHSADSAESVEILKEVYAVARLAAYRRKIR